MRTINRLFSIVTIAAKAWWNDPGLLFLGALLLIALSFFSGCGVNPRPTPPTPPAPVPVTRVVQLTVWSPVDPSATLTHDDGHLAACRYERLDINGGRVTCTLETASPNGWGASLTVTAPDYGVESARVQLPATDASYPLEIDGMALRATPKNPPLIEKAALLRTLQMNFGTIRLPGCGLHMDALFDPYLLIKWVEDRGCFERMMQAHMDRGDNAVAVDPRSGYHGHNDIDLWHEPARFAQFLSDVRAHTNIYGEPMRVFVFFGADSHINNMFEAGAMAHWKRDVDAIAAAAESLIDVTVPCWECRHQQDWVNAKGYVEMGRYVAAQFPRALHAQHLIVGSSSWSSWRCDPDNVFDGVRAQDLPVGHKDRCTWDDAAPLSDRDDPNRGNEPGAWSACDREGWCDVQLYQFDIGSAYLYPDAEPPNYTGCPGALGRWCEIVWRLDSGGRGWIKKPVIAWEFIYDTYWQRDPKATEAYALDFCQRALRYGGAACGSASYRRP